MDQPDMALHAALQRLLLNEGANAARSGLPHGCNPYVTDRHEGALWLQGWTEAYFTMLDPWDHDTLRRGRPRG